MTCGFLDVLRFIFSSFWIWAGTVILCIIAAEGIGGLIRVSVFRGPRGGSSNG